MSTHDMEDIFAFATMILLLLIPTVSILCRHQVRMAALLRPNPQNEPEIRELKAIVAQQAMAIDSLVAAQRELASEIRSSRELSEIVRS